MGDLEKPFPTVVDSNGDDWVRDPAVGLD